MAQETIKIPITLLSGDVIEVTFPTDEQWAYRARKRRIVQRTVRGDTTNDIEGNDQVDLEIFREISGRKDYDDAAEAALALERLADSDVLEVVRSADGYTVTLSTFKEEPDTYQLGSLTAGQLKRYRKVVTAVSDRSGKTAIQTNLEVPAKLFDELAPTLRGTSIIYKAAVMSAVTGEAQRLLEVSNRPY